MGRLTEPLILPSTGEVFCYRLKHGVSEWKLKNKLGAYETAEEQGLLFGKWIPCSERLPKSEDKYGWINCNVTVMRSHWPTSSYDFCDAPYDEYFVTGAMYDSSQKIWHLSCDVQLNALIDIEDLPLNSECVIAWMPLPEPYKGE